MNRNRGYFGIGVYHGRTEVNIGTLWRSAYNFGAAFIFTIGRRYTPQSSDTLKTPRHIPLYNYSTFEDFQNNRPFDCPLIGVEQCEGAEILHELTHPQRAMYLLGAEDHGLPPSVLEKCQRVVYIDTPMCLNVAVAGSIVMYERQLCVDAVFPHPNHRREVPEGWGKGFVEMENKGARA